MKLRGSSRMVCLRWRAKRATSPATGLLRLEAALTTADTTRARLLEAVLHEALDPAAQAVTEAAE